MDIGQSRPTSASIQQNAGNNPVVTQEADRSHHQQTTVQKIHNAEQVRISPDARDYLKREQNLAESQLRTTTRQFNLLEDSLDDRTVMSHLSRLSDAQAIDNSAILGIGMFEMEGMEPIVGVVADLPPAERFELEQAIADDEPMMRSLRDLPSQPLPQEAVNELLPTLAAESGSREKTTEILMQLVLETMLHGLQTQLKDMDVDIQVKSASAEVELPVTGNGIDTHEPDQRQRLKASILTIEGQLADQQGRQPRNAVASI